MRTTETDRARLPRRVEIALVRKGLTITEVASKIGKSKSTVSLVLRGKLTARDTARQIAEVLGIHVKDFASRETNGIRKKRHGAKGIVKGSRDAVLLALNVPSRCAPEDVDLLMNEVDAAAMPVAAIPDLTTTLRKK